jgi:hypothetical protein
MKKQYNKKVGEKSAFLLVQSLIFTFSSIDELTSKKTFVPLCDIYSNTFYYSIILMTTTATPSPTPNWKDYNTSRNYMPMPEYGRNIQRMVLNLLNIPDRNRRTEQAYSVIATMGNLFPHLRNIDDFKHKLWDHLFIISDFRLDIDSPYPKPSPATFDNKPDVVSYLNPKDVEKRHYGRYVPNMVWYTANLPSGEARTQLIKTLANHMKRIYLVWNKDVVTDDIIFKDIEAMSGGRITMDGTQRLKVNNYSTPPPPPNSRRTNNNPKNNNPSNQQRRKHE